MTETRFWCEDFDRHILGFGRDEGASSRREAAEAGGNEQAVDARKPRLGPVPEGRRAPAGTSADRQDLIGRVCPHCHIRVVPSPDSECPSCRRNVDEPPWVLAEIVAEAVSCDMHTAEVVDSEHSGEIT